MPARDASVLETMPRALAWTAVLVAMVLLFLGGLPGLVLVLLVASSVFW